MGGWWVGLVGSAGGRNGKEAREREREFGAGQGHAAGDRQRAPLCDAAPAHPPKPPLRGHPPPPPGPVLRAVEELDAILEAHPPVQPAHVRKVEPVPLDSMLAA